MEKCGTTSHRLYGDLLTLTRNLKLIKAINHFEQGLSYSKLPEINTAFAKTKLTEAQTSIAIPAETQSNQ